MTKPSPQPGSSQQKRQYLWAQVARRLQPLKADSEVRVPKDRIIHPRDLPAFRRSTGWPKKGGIAHWRATLPDGRCLHAVERKNDFMVHLDQVDPAIDLVGHLAQDSPSFFVLTALTTGLALGAGVTYVATGRTEDASSGAVLGALFSALLAAGAMGQGASPEKLIETLSASANPLRATEPKQGQGGTRG